MPAVPAPPTPRHPGAGAARLIEGGLPTDAFVADVLISKYAWHLPLYRQAQILAAEGIDIDRWTLAHWVGFAAVELGPLHERLLAILKSSTKLFADETRCPVLDPGRGKTKTGYLWALARDDRPWGGSRSAGGGLHVRTGPRRRARRAPSRRLQRRAAGRRLRRLQALTEPDAPAVRSCSPSAGRTSDAASTTSPRAATRRSRRRRCSASRKLYEIEAEIRGRAPMSAAPNDRHEQAARRRSKPGWRSSSPASPRARPSPMTSATASAIGRASSASSTTAASRSTAISSSVPSGRSR